MTKFAVILGVVLAAGAVYVHKWYRPVSSTSYTVTLTVQNGQVRADKTPPPYVIREKHWSRWNFINNAEVDIYVKFSEPGICHFEFSPAAAGDCTSSPVKIDRAGGRGTIDVIPAVDYNGIDCSHGRSCATDISARMANENNFRRVDPDLQIEKDTLFLKMLLIGGSAASFAYALVQWLRRRKLTPPRENRPAS